MGHAYSRPVHPDTKQVLRLFEQGLTREQVAARIGRRESAPLYQLWINERGTPTPRMMRTAELEKWGVA